MPTVQFVPRADVLDLGWGHPHPDALPRAEWARATAQALARYGADALAYGHASGPAPLIEWLCARLGEVDAGAPGPDEVFVTGGASHALELVCAQLVRPTDVVLVQSPTYHLALRILADHAADLVPVPEDGTGIDPQATGQLISRLRAQGRRVPLLYLVPTFTNPTGASLADDRRAALIEAAYRAGTVLVEDDTYRELCYDGPPPPSLYALAGGTGVVRIGSFAKSVAPGLRLGFVTAAEGLVSRLARRGYVQSGGGLNHTTALAMAQFAASGAYGEHVTRIRARYRRHRDALVAALDPYRPGLGFDVPAGGWFLWLRLPAGPDAAALLPAAEAAGVSYVDGRQFHVDRVGRAGRDRIRLAFSMLAPDDLAEAARRLAGLLTARVAGPP